MHVKTSAVGTSFTSLVRELAGISRGGFWCELGYHTINGGFEDLNEKAERGYLPFEIQVFAETKARRDRILKQFTLAVGSHR